MASAVVPARQFEIFAGKQPGSLININREIAAGLLGRA
jgi:hypothetical protein